VRIWERFLQVKGQLPDNAGRGGIGTPDQLRAHLARYEKAGIDQVSCSSSRRQAARR